MKAYLKSQKGCDLCKIGCHPVKKRPLDGDKAETAPSDGSLAPLVAI